MGGSLNKRWREILIGREYNATKKDEHSRPANANAKRGGQVDHPDTDKTGEKVAKKHGLAIDEALAAGEVETVKVGEGYKYVLGNLPSEGIDNADVQRWRKLREIPQEQRPSRHAVHAQAERDRWQTGKADEGTEKTFI